MVGTSSVFAHIFAPLLVVVACFINVACMYIHTICMYDCVPVVKHPLLSGQFVSNIIDTTICSLTCVCDHFCRCFQFFNYFLFLPIYFMQVCLNVSPTTTYTFAAQRTVKCSLPLGMWPHIGVTFTNGTISPCYFCCCFC